MDRIVHHPGGGFFRGIFPICYPAKCLSPAPMRYSILAALLVALALGCSQEAPPPQNVIVVVTATPGPTTTTAPVTMPNSGSSGTQTAPVSGFTDLGAIDKAARAEADQILSNTADQTTPEEKEFVRVFYSTLRRASEIHRKALAVKNMKDMSVPSAQMKQVLTEFTGVKYPTRFSAAGFELHAAISKDVFGMMTAENALTVDGLKNADEQINDARDKFNNASGLLAATLQQIYNDAHPNIPIRP